MHVKLCIYQKIISRNSDLIFFSSSICSATISRIPKKVYSRKYKVRLVQPDGSSFFIRYEKPLKLIKQPINPAEMTEEEKRARMRRLKPEKPKTIYELEDEDGDHDQRSWANLMKKKSWKSQSNSIIAQKTPGLAYCNGIHTLSDKLLWKVSAKNSSVNMKVIFSSVLLALNSVWIQNKLNMCDLSEMKKMLHGQSFIRENWKGKL